MSESVHTPDVRVVSNDRHPVIAVSRVSEARAEPPVIGERLLSLFESWFVRLNRLMSRAVPEELNPFAQMGAVANTTFAIALVTGILLLFWYSASVNSAHSSLEAMRDSPYLAELMRSLHRYSSDACMLFVSLHAFQTLAARKVGGARWLAWVSGALLLGLLWFDGWTGYWLVWDLRAQQIASGSATVLDSLPLFQDPVSRSFLTNGSVNSLLFFIVFFVHMLIPLAMGIFLWVHIMRLNKSKFFTNRSLTVFVTVTLIALSLLYPATSEEAANMGVIPQQMEIDWFYLLPMFLTDRLTGAAIWLVVLFTTVIGFGLPWMIVRRRATPSIVNEKACNGCTQCYVDCPYNAIDLIARVDGKGENPVVARINPEKCVGCGVCVGSCDSTAIDQGRLPVLDVRRWVNHVAKPDEDAPHHVAFVCAESAGANLRLEPDGSSPDLPGYHVLPVPCIGYVHMLTVERALRHGTDGVLVVGCSSDPVCRHGASITADRISGDRSPALRIDGQVDASTVRYLQLDRGDTSTLANEALSFREGRGSGIRPTRKRVSQVLIVTAAVVVTVAITLGLSAVPYSPPAVEGGQLVVSFKHEGNIVESNLVVENDEDTPVHMRRTQSTERVRLPVRMGIWIDNELVSMQEYAPSGLFADGTSIAVEEHAVEPGDHLVTIKISDDGDDEVWNYVDEQTVTFTFGRRRVVLFDRIGQFKWYRD